MYQVCHNSVSIRPSWIFHIYTYLLQIKCTLMMSCNSGCFCFCCLFIFYKINIHKDLLRHLPSPNTWGYNGWQRQSGKILVKSSSHVGAFQITLNPPWCWCAEKDKAIRVRWKGSGHQNKAKEPGEWRKWQLFLRHQTLWGHIPFSQDWNDYWDWKNWNRTLFDDIIV